MEQIDFTAILPAALVDNLRKYASRQIDENDPCIASYMTVLAHFAKERQTFGYAMQYLLNMAANQLRKGTPNASYGCDTPWTVRGEAIDAQDRAEASLAAIIDWVIVMAPTTQGLTAS